MTGISVERKNAARALARFVASEVGRETMRLNNYVSGTPILPAHESDTVVAVMARVRQAGGSEALVAVHFPERESDIEFMHLAAGEPVEDRLPTGGESTIGMVIDVLKGSHRTLTVSVSQQVTAGAFELAGVARR